MKKPTREIRMTGTYRHVVSKKFTIEVLSRKGLNKQIWDKLLELSELLETLNAWKLPPKK